jgi:hypothetical protein
MIEVPPGVLVMHAVLTPREYLELYQTHREVIKRASLMPAAARFDPNAPSILVDFQRPFTMDSIRKEIIKGPKHGPFREFY